LKKFNKKQRRSKRFAWAAIQQRALQSLQPIEKKAKGIKYEKREMKEKGGTSPQRSQKRIPSVEGEKAA